MQKIRYYITKINNNILHAEPGESRWQKIPTYIFNKLRNLSFSGINLSEKWYSLFTKPYVPQSSKSQLLNQHYGIEKYPVWLKQYTKKNRSKANKDKESGSDILVIVTCNPGNVDLLEQTVHSFKKLYKRPKEVQIICYGLQKEADSNGFPIHFAASDLIGFQCKNDFIRNTTASHILELNSGDCLSKEAIQLFDQQVKANPGAEWIYANYDHLDESGQQFAPVFKSAAEDESLNSGYEYLQGNVFSSILLKKLLSENNGGYTRFAKAISLASQRVQIQELLIHVHERNSDLDSLKLQEQIQKSLLEKQHIRAQKAPEGFGFCLRNEGTANPKVSIIIPTKDKTEILKVAIESIVQKTTYPNYEIILIDNNSSTEEFKQAVKQWEQTIPGFICVQVSSPFNFSELIDIGAAKASGSFLILLNNDTEVITPDWIEGMLNHAIKTDVGAVGAKLLFHNNTIQHAGIVINKAGQVRHIHSGCRPDEVVYLNALNRTMNYSALTAACLMVEKSKFDKVKGFDLQFAVSYNDIDFCLRLQQMGLRNVYAPDVTLYHYESISRGHPFASKKSYGQYVQETKLFNERWLQDNYRDPFLPEYLDVKTSGISLEAL
jgi:GT2 family glycosyltransferase